MIKVKIQAKYHKILMRRFWEIVFCVPFFWFVFFFISFHLFQSTTVTTIINYSNYHIAYMHTLTTLRSTQAIIIKFLHMISLFKTMPLFYKCFSKKEETKYSRLQSPLVHVRLCTIAFFATMFVCLI